MEKPLNEFIVDPIVPKLPTMEDPNILPTDGKLGPARLAVAEAIQSSNYKEASAGWKLDSNGHLILNNPVPASTTAFGIPGMLAWSSTHLYVCIARNSWKRVAIATW